MNIKNIPPSIWLLFIAGILFAWILSRLRNYIPEIINTLRKRMGGVRENISLPTDVRLQNDVYRFAQKQHLAASLFSLNEIAITPKVLTPLIQVPSSMELAPTDSVSLTVPYVPDWPELGAAYNASTMTLSEALQGGANIILAGHPGSGKTVALAWLASSISRNEPGLGILSGLLPLYVHATDIYPLLHHSEQVPTESEKAESGDLVSAVGNPKHKHYNTDESVDILTNAISTYVSPINLTRLPKTIRTALEKQRAILLLDRVDELPPNQSREITNYIGSLLESYPKLRVVTALSFEDLAGLPALGFHMLAMAAWSEYDRDHFLQRWGRLWNKWVFSIDKNQAKKVHPRYLNSWLKSDNSMLKPLEYVLKVWAAYAGDIQGTDGPSAIEAYLLRVTNDVSDSRPGLERFALQQLLEMDIASKPHHLDRLISDDEAETIQSTANSAPEAADASQPAPPKPPRIKKLSGIDTLINNGLLVSYSGSHYGFSHPVFGTYLAGNAITGHGIIDRIRKQPAWIGKTLGMYYHARNGDVSALITNLIQEDDILHTNHLLISRWLQVAPKNRPWRTIILRTLATVLQKEKDTISLAAKFISAMTFSGDVGVSIYFRQLLKSDNPNLKQLAALGCGILKEKKAIEDLNLLLQEQSPSSVRAASLALAAIGDKQSLELLATNLLNGNELVRRCSAEALANDQKEGHPALKDGSTMEDLMVRRAVAFGLIRVNQPWATKIIENMQLEDSEWVVRNAAIQVFDELSRKSMYAPKPLVDPTETQWLINYASKVGTTVAPGPLADELVVKALAGGSQDEILNSLDYLRIKCDTQTANYVYAAFSNNPGEIKDAAYYVLWLMMSSGIKMPLSVKYNIK